MALEVIANTFPVLDRRSLQQLDKDADRLTAALKNLPEDFQISDMENLISQIRPPLVLNYHPTLARTLTSMVSTDNSSLLEFAAA